SAEPSSKLSIIFEAYSPFSSIIILMLVSLITVFPQLLLFCAQTFALPITNHNHNSGDVKTYDSVNLQKRGYRPAWVFWYYSGGERDCGNYCLISFLLGWERRHNTEDLSENEGDEGAHEVARERRERRQETEQSVPLTPPPPYTAKDTK
ncbi:5047_t:CDS:2, partial [Racocetra persica]